jgi:hypothetical protein
MKTCFIIALLSLSAQAWAQQNTVLFRNNGAIFKTPQIDRLVYRDFVGGTRLVGTNFVAGLWYGPGTDPTSVDGRISPDRGLQTGVLCPFRIPTTTLPGTWNSPSGASAYFPLNGLASGQYAVLQVRVWDIVKYPTFPDAVAGGEFGASVPFVYVVPQFDGTPSDYAMEGLRAFSLTEDSRTISVDDLVASEGSNGVATANFVLRLHGSQTDPVSVDFATQNGTALSGTDYVATNGTVTFAPGETAKAVSVLLLPDGPPEEDEVFYLNLSNAVNGRLGDTQAACTITEVRIVGLRVDTSISFNTVVNHRYVVERTSNMVSWEPVAGATNVLGTGSIISIVDQGTGCEAMRAYRARLLTD